MSDATPQRQAGLDKMVEVYGDDRGMSELLPTAPPEAFPYMNATVERLFAELWSRPGLPVRDRLLLVIGVTAARGRIDLLETQLTGALKGGHLTREQLGEAVMHIAYYAGWGNAQAMQIAALAAARNAPDAE